MTDLYELDAEIRMIEDLMENEEVDDESFRAFLDRLNIEKRSVIANLGLAILNRKAEIEARKQAIQRLRDKNAATERAIERTRNYINAHLDEKVKTPLVSVYRMKGRERVVVDDPVQMVDAGYGRYVAEPNKTAAKAAFDDGGEVPGAHIERGDPTVVVR